jgi:hypothetical protein
MSSTEINDLQRIAALCPTVYGDVVYGARGLIADFDNTRYELPECATDEPRERKEKDIDKVISISPNPTAKEISFNYNGKTALVNIEDISGRKIFELQNYISGENINISNLDSGIYFVHITINEKTISKKFIKVDY